MMIQHRLEAICSVNNTRSLDSGMSLELPSAMSIEFFAQQVLIVPHVDVSINLSMRRYMSNNVKKTQIIKTLALK
jgi:hypothetical protein